jgi:large subunit ribosomal protein L35
MPKLKTHKGSVKRMKLTRRGKITAKRAGKGHLMSGKSSKRRRALSRKQTLSASVTRRYTRALTGR